MILMEKVYQLWKNSTGKTEACVDVNGSLTDVFKCRLGVRQGDNLSPLLFIFMNDFLERYLEAHRYKSQFLIFLL